MEVNGEKASEPALVELFHRYKDRLKEYGISLTTYNNSFKLDTGNGNNTYVNTIHDVITFYNGFSASIEQETTKREKLIELLMAENKENKEYFTNNPFGVPSPKGVITNNDPLGLLSTIAKNKP